MEPITRVRRDSEAQWMKPVGWLTSADYVDTATGFLVGEWWLLTAGHVIPTRRMAAGFVLTFNHLEDTRPAERDSFALDPEAGFFTAYPAIDFTVTRVRPSFDRARSPSEGRGMIALASAVIPTDGMRLACVQHPDSDRVKCLSWGIARNSGSPFTHSATAGPGSSGAPLVDATGALVGMHKGGERDSDLWVGISAVAIQAALGGRVLP